VLVLTTIQQILQDVETKKYYCVFRPARDDLVDESPGAQSMQARYDDEESANRAGQKATRFKYLLLAICQQQFYQDNIYEDIDKELSPEILSKLSESVSKGRKLP